MKRVSQVYKSAPARVGPSAPVISFATRLLHLRHTHRLSPAIAGTNSMLAGKEDATAHYCSSSAPARPCPTRAAARNVHGANPSLFQSAAVMHMGVPVLGLLLDKLTHTQAAHGTNTDALCYPAEMQVHFRATCCRPSTDFKEECFSDIPMTAQHTKTLYSLQSHTIHAIHLHTSKCTHSLEVHDPWPLHRLGWVGIKQTGEPSTTARAHAVLQYY